MTLDVFEHLPPPARAALTLGLAIVAGWLVSWVFEVAFRRFASRTATELDDIVVQHARFPLAGSVVLYGVWLALAEFDLGPRWVAFVRHTLLTAVILAWTWGVARGAGAVLAWLGRHQERWSLVNGRTLPLFEIVGKGLVYGGAIYFLFLAWDVDVTAWLASAGVIGIAVGFAAKDTLSNLIAGVFILADAPYKLGDYLVIGTGERGVVTEIGFRTTRILTRDDIEIIVPNGTMATATIINESGGPYEARRLRVPIGVAYGSDVDVVRAILERIPADVPGIIAPPRPIVRFEKFGSSSLDFTLRVWIERPELRGKVLDELNTRIYKSLLAAGIEIPYSKHDVYLHHPPTPRAAPLSPPDDPG